MLAGLVIVGMVTCVVSSRTDTWWSKYASYFDMDVAHLVNRSPASLVLAGGPIPLLGLSHLVAPRVMLRLDRGGFEPPVSESYSEVFVFTPSGEWLRSLSKRDDYRLSPVFAAGKLWRLEQN